MQVFLWVIIVWIAGTAAILGSLMMLGSLLLWLIPISPKTGTPSSIVSNTWQQRLRLLLFSLALTIVGWSILNLTPFPSS